MTTLQDYLAFERLAEMKHEYVDGDVIERPGGTSEHSLIAGNFMFELRNALKDRKIWVLGPLMRFKTGRGDCLYPDVSVTIPPAVFHDDERDVILNPAVIVEVLSESTEADDRGRKFESYQSIETLTDYIMASQDKVCVEHFRRLSRKTWEYCALGPADRLVVPSLACEIPVPRLYRDVFPPA